MGDIKVDIVVRPTESARSPLDINVITLEAVPPGEHPNNITPVASSGFNEKTRINNIAIAGIIVYCSISPVIKALGNLNTFRKSCGFIVNPIANIIIANNILTAGNNIDRLLKHKANIVARITSTVKFFEKKREVRLSMSISYKYLYNINLSIL
jgi:EamA domain-containing membrane protein RarD